jgi:hypothetical protein
VADYDRTLASAMMLRALATPTSGSQIVVRDEDQINPGKSFDRLLDRQCAPAMLSRSQPARPKTPAAILIVPFCAHAAAKV